MSATLFSLQGKTALVTGGANGLGRMIAEGFAQAGARVFLTSRKEADAKAAAAEICTFGRAIGIAADLATPEGCALVTKVLREDADALSVLVNNAGRTWGGALDTFPDKGWSSVLPVNVQTPFTIVRDALPLLEAAAQPDDPARVINIGSIAGKVVEPLQAYSYAASKAALHHLTRVMAADLAARGIAVNTVIPGYFPTHMTDHVRADQERYEDLVRRIPLRRMGEPGDIIGACIFLASRASAYMTGAELVVDGGMSGCR